MVSAMDAADDRAEAGPSKKHRRGRAKRDEPERKLTFERFCAIVSLRTGVALERIPDYALPQLELLYEQSEAEHAREQLRSTDVFEAVLNGAFGGDRGGSERSKFINHLNAVITGTKVTKAAQSEVKANRQQLMQSLSQLGAARK